MNLRKKKKGFTLIELMAVVAIIAILAAVLVPTVNGYITRSKKTAIITQARTVVNAIESMNATTVEGAKITYSTNKLKDELATGGQLANSDLVKASDVKNIQEETLKELQTINNNEDGNILDKIVLEGNNFKSLAE